MWHYQLLLLLTPTNLARALEVAEELLQAIKQATPNPTGKQSVLELPLSWGSKLTRCVTKKRILAYSSTPYVGMTPIKMAATLKVYK